MRYQKRGSSVRTRIKVACTLTRNGIIAKRVGTNKFTLEKSQKDYNKWIRKIDITQVLSSRKCCACCLLQVEKMPREYAWCSFPVWANPSPLKNIIYEYWQHKNYNIWKRFDLHWRTQTARRTNPMVSFVMLRVAKCSCRRKLTNNKQLWSSRIFCNGGPMKLYLLIASIRAEIVCFYVMIAFLGNIRYKVN